MSSSISHEPNGFTPFVSFVLVHRARIIGCATARLYQLAAGHVVLNCHRYDWRACGATEMALLSARTHKEARTNPGLAAARRYLPKRSRSRSSQCSIQSSMAHGHDGNRISRESAVL